jgi:hypothetical protein
MPPMRQVPPALVVFPGSRRCMEMFWKSILALESHVCMCAAALKHFVSWTHVEPGAGKESVHVAASCSHRVAPSMTCVSFHCLINCRVTSACTCSCVPGKVCIQVCLDAKYCLASALCASEFEPHARDRESRCVVPELGTVGTVGTVGSRVVASGKGSLGQT